MFQSVIDFIYFKYGIAYKTKMQHLTVPDQLKPFKCKL